MQPGRIEGATRTLGAPQAWDKSKDGPCGGLPVRDEVTANGRAAMVSAWFPTPEEMILIAAGAPVTLCIINNQHPPVSIGVGKAPE